LCHDILSVLICVLNIQSIGVILTRKVNVVANLKVLYHKFQGIGIIDVRSSFI